MAGIGKVLVLVSVHIRTACDTDTKFVRLHLDPYLAGIGGALITRGTQKEGVIATPKVCDSIVFIRIRS